MLPIIITMKSQSAKTKLRETLPGVFDLQASTTDDIDVGFGLKAAAEEEDEDFDF